MNFSLIETNEANFTTEVIDQSANNSVLVYFYADWCSFCQELTPRLERISSEYNLVLAKVNVDQNPNLTRSYGVQSFPTVQLFNNGVVTDNFLGAKPTASILDFFYQNEIQPLDLIKGTIANDTLSGGLGNDKIAGAEGDDRLIGDRGEDRLYGEIGNDRLLGGSGNDYLWGGSGNDIIIGGANSDYLWGGSDNDSLNGANGDDNLYGELGNDNLVGGAGNDSLVGGAGSDLLQGGKGNDLLVGETLGNGQMSPPAAGITLFIPPDTLTGGTGADLFVLGDSSGSYYLDPSGKFALITDFERSQQDKMIVFDSKVASDYSFSYDAATSMTTLLFQNDPIAKFNTLNVDLSDLIFV